jgi:predicted Zn-dependent protease
VIESKAKKDEYQKALAAYGHAMKEFHKGELEKAAESLQAFIDKFPNDRELVDRARIYLTLAERRPRREAVSLKSLEDHFQSSVFKLNQGDYEGALKTLEKALEFQAEEGRVYFLMADAYMLMNQPEAALENLKKAVQKDKFFSILAQNESDFEPLWEDKKFRLLMRLA